jgi:hypothetical protein
VEPPEVLEDLDEIIETREERLNRLEELSESAGELRNEVASLNSERRETVAPTMRTLSAEFPDITDVEALAAAHDRLVEAVAAPHRNAVSQTRGDVLATLDITDRIDRERMERLEDRLAEFSPEVLRAATETFEEIDSRLESFPDAAVTVIAEAVVSEPEQYLSVPVTELNMGVNSVDERVALLTSLDGVLERMTWGPSSELADAREHYQIQPLKIDSEALLEHVEAIDNRVDEARSIAVAPIIEAHLDRELPASELASVPELLSGLSRTVATCVNHLETFEKTADLADNLASPIEHDAKQVVRLVDEIQSFTRSIGDATDVIDDYGENSGPVDRLAELLSPLDSSYSAWGSRYAERLGKDAVAIEAVRSQIPDAPAFTSEPDALPVDSQEIVPAMIRDDPVAAIRTHEAYQTWAASLREWRTGGDESTATVGYLLTLVREGELSATEVSSGDYERLCELLGGELTLHFEEVERDETEG